MAGDGAWPQCCSQTLDNESDDTQSVEMVGGGAGTSPGWHLDGQSTNMVDSNAGEGGGIDSSVGWG